MARRPGLENKQDGWSLVGMRVFSVVRKKEDGQGHSHQHSELHYLPSVARRVVGGGGVP